MSIRTTVLCSVVLAAAYSSLAWAGKDPVLAEPVAAAVPQAAATYSEEPIFFNVMVDVTGSFVDTVLSGDFLRRVTDRVDREISGLPLPKKSLVRVSVIGHFNESNTAGGSYNHLDAKDFVVGGKYTRDKVISGVNAFVRNIYLDIQDKKIKKQESTSVVMNVDRSAEIFRKSGLKKCRVVVVSDLDDTELGLPLPDPMVAGGLEGCVVTAFGAGVTLREGTKAERALRVAWGAWMKTAGVAPRDFFWIPNP